MTAAQATLPPERAKILVWALAAYAVATLISMAVMGIGAALLFAAMLYAFGGPRSLFAAARQAARVPALKRYFAVSLTLAAACALSLAAAKVAPLGWGGRYVEVSFWADMGKAWYLFWPLLIAPALLAVGESGRRAALRAWLVATAAVSAIGVVQFFTGWPKPQPIPGFPGHFHAIVFLGHHLSVASILIFPFFASLDLAFSRTGERVAGLARPVLALIAALSLVTLVLTFSRMLWVALPAGIILWALVRLPRRWALATLAAVGIAALAATQVPFVHNRTHDALGVGDRETLWRANWEFFKARPLTGTGWRHTIDASGIYLTHLHPGQEVFSGHAHNDFLEMLAGTGILGLLAWLAWCVLVLRDAGRAALRRPSMAFGAGLLAAWAVFQLNGLTQVNFWEGKVMHQMAWAVAWALAWAVCAAEAGDGERLTEAAR